MNLRSVAFWAGPLLFLAAALLPSPGGMSDTARLTAGITLWMAIWWITEVMEPAITSLLPMILFPLCGILPLKSISSEYGNEIIYLFMAGFFFGKTIEKWQLHRRIALQMVLWLGTNPSRIVLGFMCATAFLSMWISNTATVVMMTPVAVAMAISQQAGLGDDTDRRNNFGKALLLGVSFAATIGGMATLVGTPTNAIFAAFWKQKMQADVSFFNWLKVGLPVSIVLLFAAWGILMALFKQPKPAAGSLNQDALLAEQQALGYISAAEWRIMLIFGTVVLAWISGSLVWYKWFPNCNDTVVALSGAIVLFLLPAEGWRAGTGTLLDWPTAKTIPWSIMLFFGGGLALAKGFEQSGLAAWVGTQLIGLHDLPAWVVMLAALVVIILLSEVASNIATATMMIPILASMATTTGMDAYPLLMIATMAASVGFGLPVATAANSIVYAVGFLDAKDMAKSGFLLDIIAIIVLLIAYLLL